MNGFSKNQKNTFQPLTVMIIVLNHSFNVHHNLQHLKQFLISAGVSQNSDIALLLYTIYTSYCLQLKLHSMEFTQTILLLFYKHLQIV